MSRFFSTRYTTLVPYVPGEQPLDMEYIKLNTNESPFPPVEEVTRAVAAECGKLQLYSDPECIRLRRKMSEVFSLPIDQIMMSNGSDEALNLAFMAFGDENSPLVFPDVSYGFYSIFANVNRIPYTEIPLDEKLNIRVEDYMNCGKTVCLANPNAPTGQYLPLEDIERIVKSNPGHVVIIDEAYIDFGGESARTLIDKYDNLLVIGTFSKSRSMAGARLGFALGNEKLIADLNTLRFSTNPYDINRMTDAAGIAALSRNDYYMANCLEIIKNRDYTKSELEKLGFSVLPSMTNFLFAASPRIEGEALYRELKKRGVLVRHFNKDRISAYNRITIGTREQMDRLLQVIRAILEETV